MKANEFVKTHGIKSAQDIVKYYGNHTHITDDARMFITEEFYKKTHADYVDDLNSMVRMVDLKRLVESHELVERIGGLERVKKAIDGKHIGYTHFYLHSNDRYVFLDHYVDFIPDQAQHIGMFNKAISDVESCNG